MNSTLKNLKSELTPEYLNKVIMQTYYVEFGHLIIALFVFLSILVNPNEYFLMAIIFSIVNFFIRIPFCLIQRHNRPRLFKVIGSVIFIVAILLELLLMRKFVQFLRK